LKDVEQMAKPISLYEYVRGPINRGLLVRFAETRLKAEWPRQKTAVANAIEHHLDDTIDTLLGPNGPYKAWTMTPQNVQDINAAIWKNLRQAVEHSMKGAMVDPEEALDGMLQRRGPMMPFEDTKSDGVVPDRDLESLRDQYLDSWRS
jgi:hypothetical protein